MKSLLSIVALLAASSEALKNNPEKPFLATWLDTTDSSPGAKDGDRPVKFNERMNLLAGAFQYAQDLPIPAGQFPFPDDQIDATGTNAVAFLTVYPKPSPWSIPDSDIQALAQQCARLTNVANRRLILRLAPEMNGNWNQWGQQPSLFITFWRKVYSAVKAVAPGTDFAWSPSSGNGYPYTNKTYPEADRALLDTNKDGVVNDRDDPYSPYYPGDEFVDWVGVSIYTYGSVFPWTDNISAPPGKFESILNDHDFYQLYSVRKNKPFMVAESGAAFHVNSPLGAGVGELETKRSWWRQYFTSAEFLRSHPNIKLICGFEFQKFEEKFATGDDSLRDFRISNKTEIRSAFLQDFESVKGLYTYATKATTPSTSGTATRSISLLIVYLSISLTFF